MTHPTVYLITDEERFRIMSATNNTDVVRMLQALQPTRQIEGYKLLRDTLHIDRNYPEDASHENGDYCNTCHHCGRDFLGNKRRVTCKACTTPEAKPT